MYSQHFCTFDYLHVKYLPKFTFIQRIKNKNKPAYVISKERDGVLHFAFEPTKGIIGARFILSKSLKDVLS